MPPYLHKHPKSGIYFFRRAIPEPLRQYANKREIFVSLRTTCINEAKRLYGDELKLSEQLLDNWRSQHLLSSRGCPQLEVDATAPALEEKMIPLLVERYLANMVNTHLEFPPRTKEARQEQIDEYQALLQDLKEAASLNDTSAIAEAGFAQLEQEKINIAATNEATLQSYQLALLRADIQALTLQLTQLSGDYVARQPVPRISCTADTWSDLIETWILAKQPQEKTIQDVRKQAQRFDDYFKHRSLMTITRTEVIEFSEYLTRELGQSAKRASALIHLLRAVLQTSIDREACSYKTNPFDRIPIDASQKPVQYRQPFDTTHLKAWLTSPIYTQPSFRPRTGGGDGLSRSPWTAG